MATVLYPLTTNYLLLPACPNKSQNQAYDNPPTTSTVWRHTGKDDDSDSASDEELNRYTTRISRDIYMQSTDQRKKD